MIIRLLDSLDSVYRLRDVHIGKAKISAMDRQLWIPVEILKACWQF